MVWWDNWLRIQHGPLLSAREWLHVCVRLDRELALLNVSVNGGEMRTLGLEQEVKPEDLTRINIDVGLSPPVWREKYPEQFLGLVTNINIYQDTSGQLDIQKMSSNPCQFAAAGDLLAWEDTEWVEDGEHLEQIDLEPGEVCDEDDDQPMFNIPLVLKLNWFNANRTCNILNNGTISEMRDLTEVNSITSKFRRRCDYIWSPYVFSESKPEFQSSDLSWYGNVQGPGPFVAVYLFTSTPQLLKFAATERFCVACRVQKRRVFTLWGVCDQSLLGKKGSNILNINLILSNP